LWQFSKDHSLGLLRPHTPATNPGGERGTSYFDLENAGRDGWRLVSDDDLDPLG
jgi:hypothetical protein